MSRSCRALLVAAVVILVAVTLVVPAVAVATKTAGCYSAFTSWTCTSPLSPNPIVGCTPDIAGPNCPCIGNPNCRCAPSTGAVPCPNFLDLGLLTGVKPKPEARAGMANTQAEFFDIITRLTNLANGIPDPRLKGATLTAIGILTRVRARIVAALADPPDFHWGTPAPYIIRPVVPPGTQIGAVPGLLTATESQDFLNYLTAMSYMDTELEAGLGEMERAQGALAMCQRTKANERAASADHYFANAKAWGELGNNLLIQVNFTFDAPLTFLQVLEYKSLMARLRKINYTGWTLPMGVLQGTQAAPLQNCTGADEHEGPFAPPVDDEADPE